MLIKMPTFFGTEKFT